MAKRKLDESNRKRVTPARVKVEEELRKAYIPKTVQLRLLKEINLKIQGSVTGNLYHFEYVGTVQEVDEKDAPAMLEKGKKASCCGGVDSPYFEVLGD